MTTTQNESKQRPVSILRASLICIYDGCFSDVGKVALKRLVIKISIVGFIIHLGLIFFAHCLSHPPLVEAVGKNYLGAISTPFNIILFYEVLTLIAAVPASTTRSIANQFEIVSLIFVRDVFKDLSAANEPNWLRIHPHQGLPLLVDMWSGLAMFVLTTVFQHVAQRQVRMPRTPELTAGREKFIAHKKVIAIGLTVLLLSLGAYHVGRCTVHAGIALLTGKSITLESASLFYNDLFTVMIFTDVLVLILSLVISGRYEMVFRNAAFVISIILIRLSLTEERPYGAAIALLAMVFGILTLLVFNYHSHVRASDLQNAGNHHRQRVSL